MQETLGSKCLLVADKTLDGLPISPRSECRNPDSVSESEADIVAPLINRRQSEPEDRLQSLSCAALTLEKTLSTTFSKAVSVGGESHLGYVQSVINKHGVMALCMPTDMCVCFYGFVLETLSLSSCVLAHILCMYSGM